ncbi:MAG: hypothetical protein IKD05_02665 [Tidjanibacter sp.]|nr:hypothetical protein [Tidjanibacter sp.]MBR7129160.1 hypothetical protein [Tidjanibacter sp.]
MKATKLFAMVASLLVVGCTNEIVDDNIDINNNGEGVVLTLTGDAQADDVESRIVVGTTANNGKHGVNWRTNDAIGIYSIDGTTINNVKATTTGHNVGKATFTTESKVPATYGDQLYVYYPHNASASLAGSVISATVPAAQDQTNRTVADHIGAYTIAYDTATVGEDGNVEFALQHPLAYVLVSIKSTEFADYGVKSVELVDRTGTAKLSGDVKVDMSKGAAEALTLAGNNTSSVKLTITNVVATNDSRNYWLTALPADFTNGEVWLIVQFQHPTNKNSVYVPMKFEGVKLQGGALNVITLSDVKSSDNDASWYVVNDTRSMPVMGYAYGEANTYLIQCKSGTYNGATLTPDANIPESVKVDIRGRGDFSKIGDISKATFEWAKNTQGITYTMDCRKYSHIDPTAYTIDDSTKAQGYITVKNTGAYAGSPILLMKIDGKVVWSWSFWNIAADGTKFEDVTIGNYTYANMPIGQASTQYATWMTNKRGGGSSSTDFVGRTVNVYQWGRPSPLFWQEDSAGNVDPLYQKSETAKAPTIEEAIANPEVYYLPTVSGYSGIWSATLHNDLWGDVGSKGASASAVRYKSVFDPCPKGYKVMDYNAMLDYVAQTYTEDGTTGEVGLVFGTHKYINSGYLTGSLSAGRAQAYGWSYAPTQANTKFNMNWCNVAGNNQAFSAYYQYNNTKLSSKQFNKKLALSIRCQKDTDNR